MAKANLNQNRDQPRSTAGLHPLYPKADGSVWEPKQQWSRRDEWVGQFLDAYFGINLAYARLVAFRRMYPNRKPRRLERPIVQAVQDALANKERLEDGAAAVGLIATPVYQDGFTIDLHFSDAQSARRSQGTAAASSATAFLRLRLPARLQAPPCKS